MVILIEIIPLSWRRLSPRIRSYGLDYCQKPCPGESIFKHGANALKKLMAELGKFKGEKDKSV